MIDAVFNHFGPSGNHSADSGLPVPDLGNTWGDGVSLSGPGAVDRGCSYIDGALRWMRESHADGLAGRRARHDDTPRSTLLEELAAETDAQSVVPGQPPSLVAESDLNDRV